MPFADHGLDVIPAGVTDEQALFTGDILATGYWGAGIGGIGGIEEGDTVLVIGAGPTGLCTMACARLCRPARIIAADISEERLSLARRMGIADLTVNPARKTPALRRAALHRDGARTWCLKRRAERIPSRPRGKRRARTGRYA